LITASSVLGNVSSSRELKRKYDEMNAKKACETITVSRLESGRVRMRKTSDKGSDIALILPPGTKLRHGDVLVMTEDKMVVIGIQPEDVIGIEIKSNIHADDLIEVPVKVGHTIGNLHRPVKLDGNKIFFPIQADTELDMFIKLFKPMMEHLEIWKTKMVFEPEDGTEIHEH
jgi:urease accessory protein